MQPRKTELARTALQAHRAPLDMRQRRLLILCDGQRSITDLTGLLGQDAPAMVIQLVQAGYLSTGTGAAAPPPPPAATVAPQPATPAAAAATAVERRRSLVAARIYVLGILEMQRHPQAAALFRDLQQARAESDVLQVLHSAMQMLPGLTSVGYCQRVRQRLLEALPLEHCDAFAEVA
ncbi:hypothetical protein AAHH21_06315 [Stenotrophomonas sp. BSUC-16]|jgi:hypothetical protein|uniref:hypothetical protein n=1 Tax=Stenotrophomonas TaxID=40323 RepID=UPI0006A92527|nr:MULTISPECIES: hypothetical protein [Stenotrophomonas maltophilia group]MBA0274301.1 hypothetical protein [Stenotrophomonas maltophilia]MCO5736707.1 hypothetical protein [Stenotrophomonas maltophilia]MDT3491801.1 hypothetical protein [Stenotrophomonas maltophilia group sp. msm4]UXB35925.1 hypothetical protein K7563_18690 [Stenotrophomonas maltophilia]CRX70140.1 unnamed protein product [Stenotrophomonas maltophilia]